MNLEETIANVVTCDEEGFIWEGKTYEVAVAVRQYFLDLIDEAEGDPDFMIWKLNKNG